MRTDDFVVGEFVPHDGGARVDVHVPATLKYLEGHFRHDPIVAGVAQLALVERLIKRAFPELGAPRALSRLKFEARINPNDALAVRIERTEEKVRFTIVRGETECSRGTLTY